MSGAFGSPPGMPYSRDRYVVVERRAAPITPDSAAWHERCTSRLGLRIGFLAASFLVLVGCVNPNTYTTPRTIGAWHFQNSIALEAEGAYTPAAPSTGVPAAEGGSDLVPPTYTLRLGLGHSWEIGARIGNLSSLGGDLKWNFLRSSRIDLAIDPAFQVYEVTGNDSNGISTTFSFYHVPLLVGVNLSRRASLVFTPGVSWGFASGGSERFTNGLHDGSNTSTGALGRFGVGVDLRMLAGRGAPPGGHVPAAPRRQRLPEDDPLRGRARNQLRRHAQL